MSEANTSQKLNYVIYLLGGNLLIMIIGTGAILFGLIPKIERAISATERVEARFQDFANEVQPVLTASADKAIETIKKIDAEKLSQSATNKTDTILEAAAEKAKRYLEKDKKTKPE